MHTPVHTRTLSPSPSLHPLILSPVSPPQPPPPLCLSVCLSLSLPHLSLCASPLRPLCLKPPTPAPLCACGACRRLHSRCPCTLRRCCALPLTPPPPLSPHSSHACTAPARGARWGWDGWEGGLGGGGTAVLCACKDATHTRTHIRTYTRKHTRTCTRKHTRTYTYAHTHARTHAHTHTHVHTHTGECNVCSAQHRADVDDWLPTATAADTSGGGRGDDGGDDDHDDGAAHAQGRTGATDATAPTDAQRPPPCVPLPPLRPRLLLQCAPSASLVLARALLHLLDKFPVFTVDARSVLFGTAVASPEEAVAQVNCGV